MTSQNVRYQFSNHLGSASLELDETGALITYEEYYPYGSTSFQMGPDAATVSRKRYRYTGKERDEGTGFYYHGARYYIPWLARWAAVDPLEAKYAPESTYCYAHNNPVRFTDSTGMGSKDETPAPKMLDGSSASYRFTSNTFDYKGNLVSSSNYMTSGEIDGLAHGDYTTNVYLPDPDRPVIHDGNLTVANLPSVTQSFTPFSTTAALDTSPNLSETAATGLAKATLGLIATDMAIPDPSDIALPKWIAYGVLAAAAGIAIAVEIEKIKNPPASPPVALPIAVPLPLERPKEDEGTMVYRSMKMDETGGPTIEESARGLGVRKNQDIPVVEGWVAPFIGGMSVAPLDPGNLPMHRRPPYLGGTGKDPVFELNTKDLPFGLSYRPDAPNHGTVQPTFPMTYDEYNLLLSLTKLSWKLHGK